MATTLRLSEVQLLNLSYLVTMQASVRKDAVDACSRFHLSPQQARQIEALGHDQIQVIVANLGHESLVELRGDFWRLLHAPTGLLGPLSAVGLHDSQRLDQKGRTTSLERD